MIGLGRMGGNMTRRLMKAGHSVVAFDRNPDTVKAFALEGAIAANSLEDAIGKSKADGQPAVVWVMVPSGKPTLDTVLEAAKYLQKGDIIIDGGNSFYKDSIATGQQLEALGIHYIDCGTSGGVWGLENGYCLMVGGTLEACKTCESIFLALAQTDGYLHAGAQGAGHFTKMVHNGIEYGMMQAIGEGLDIIESGPFDVDLHALTKLWNHGSVVRSWLMELAERAFSSEAHLESIKDYVEDSGEGRWTIQTAMEYNVPAPIITLSLLERFHSRDDVSFSAKVVAALRNQFGGHAVKADVKK
jgi:6-phosphogluconate dehydrogenase